MKKSYLIMAAIASVALVSCSNEEYLGDPGGLTGERAISFDMSTPAMTRDEIKGEAAAEELGYSFQVYATKKVGSTTSNVFAQNAYNATSNTPYWAWYVENTAGKTNSNLNNWEYVGGTGTHGKTGYQITIDEGKDQTIKYWDRSADSYSFMAFKAKAVTSGTATISDVTPSGFTVTGTPEQLAKLYVADKEVFEKGNTSGNVYGNPVRFTFRNFTSKIRFGIYENIPGYTVKIKNVHYNGTSNNANFGVDGNFSASSNQSYEVTYDADGRAKGAHSSGTAQNYFETENSTILSATAIGTTATGATYDQAERAYSIIMPDPNNTTGMTLKVDLTLTSEGGSGETIELTNASATVPANYCQWQSNFAYTYLFKISDLTQFQEGQLSPITLDAVVTDDGQGNQNTITVVETPSITTYQAGKVIYDDYVATAGDIFVTVSTINNENMVVLNPLVTTGLETVGNAALFTITSDNQTSFTEAEIEKALKVRTSALTATTVEGRNGIILTPANPGLTLTNTIETASGEKTVYTPTNNEDLIKKAAKFTPDANKTYAFVYTVTGSSNTNPTDMETKYEAIAGLTPGESSVAGKYCNYLYNAASGDAQSGVTYYSKTETPETYTALTTNAPTFFGQQFATGLYYDTEAATDKAAYTGYTKTAESGKKYYYIKENETTYTEAKIITYEDLTTTISGENLYTGSDGTGKVESKPTDEVLKTTIYYLREGTEGNYTYTRCVILPQQIPDNSYTRDASATKQPCPAGEKAIAGEKYYDKYEMFKGNYAVKVIKVQ